MSELPAETRLAIRQSVDEQISAFTKERRSQRVLELGVVALIVSLLSLGLYATFNDWVKAATENTHANSVARNIVETEGFEDTFQRIVSKASLRDKIDFANPLVYEWDQRKLERKGTPDIFDEIDRPMQWGDGEPVSEQDGFCFLTGVRGKFNGAGERVRVYLRDGKTPRDWWFEGNSHVGGVGASVICLRLK